MNKFILTLLIIFFIILTGTTVVQAEKSVPGDLLYRVKTGINEPAAGLFSFSKEEKTEWQERLVERRLAETKKLVTSNIFDEQKRTYLEDTLRTGISTFSTNINELILKKGESIESSDLNIRLQAAINAYQGILENLLQHNTNEETARQTEKILATLSELETIVIKNYDNLQSHIGNNPKTISTQQSVDIAYAQLTTAQDVSSSVKLLYQKEKLHLSQNIQDQIYTKLVAIDQAIDDGITFSEASNFESAIMAFQSAIDKASEVKLLIFSNVIKNSIESDTDDHFDDIEDESYETEEGEIERPNSVDLESINPHSDELEDD